jgi:hypothetical protein
MTLSKGSPLPFDVNESGPVKSPLTGFFILKVGLKLNFLILINSVNKKLDDESKQINEIKTRGNKSFMLKRNYYLRSRRSLEYNALILF